MMTSLAAEFAWRRHNETVERVNREGWKLVAYAEEERQRRRDRSEVQRDRRTRGGALRQGLRRLGLP